MMTSTEHAALVALLRSRPRNLSWRKLTEQIRQAGTALSVWSEYNPDQLIPSEDAAATVAAAESDVSDWHLAGLKFLTITDSGFPRQLLETADPPPFLFARGDVRREDPAVAVVGSRNATARGIQIASEIVRQLVKEGLSVVSGLADGIDAAAHKAALSESGRTVAFIATGINQSYPAVNRDLQKAIAREGLLLSQFWPDAPPQKQNFIKRNALISAYSLAAIVVEAGENSGARNLASHAVDQARPLILTNLVAEANNWVKELVDLPGVYVASSLTEIQSIIDGLRSKPDAAASTGDS